MKWIIRLVEMIQASINREKFIGSREEGRPSC